MASPATPTQQGISSGTDQAMGLQGSDGSSGQTKNPFQSIDAFGGKSPVGAIVSEQQKTATLPTKKAVPAVTKQVEPPKEEDYFKGGFGNFLRSVDKIVPIGIGDFVDDMARSVSAGYRQGTLAETADKLLLKGHKATPEQIQKFIEANKYAQQMKPSDEMQDYTKTYEEEGKGFWGVVKGLFKNPTVVPELITSSLVGMATNTDALIAGAATIGAGASIGATTGAAGGTAVLPVVGTVGGAAAGAIAGAEASIPYAFGVASSVVESGSTFGELLADELKGEEMTKENVRNILESPEKLNSIRNKAIARGLIIGTVDALTGKLASGVGAKIMTKSAAKSATGAVTKGAVVRATAAGAATESVGGSLGEAAARGAVGQNMDVSEIALEGIAELPGGVRSTIQARLAKPSYRVNGENVDATQVDELINTMTPEQLAVTDIKIKNDYTGKEFQIQDKIVTNSIKQDIKKANPDLNEPSLNAITQLEKELQGLEGNKTQTGKDKAAAIRTQIKNIEENQIQEEAVVETAKAEEMSVNAPEKNVFYYYEAKGEKAPTEVPAGYTSMKRVENSEEVKLWNAQKPAEVTPAEVKATETKVEEIKPTETKIEEAPKSNPAESFFNSADELFPNDHILGGYAVTDSNEKLIGRVKLSEVDNNTVKIDEVVSEKKGERTGNGSAIMNMVVDNADKNNTTLILTPNIIGDIKVKGFDTPEKLRTFYAKFGFIKDNGKATMTREPKPTEVKIEDVKPTETINLEKITNDLYRDKVSSNTIQKEGNNWFVKTEVEGKELFKSKTLKGAKEFVSNDNQEALRVKPTETKETVAPKNLAKEYIESIEKVKAEDPEKFWSVDRPFQNEDGTINEVELSKAENEGRLIKTEAGFGVVGEDGDIKGVFKSDVKSTEKTGDKVIQESVKAGGIKLDNFALPNLMKIYERNGFREVSRLPFNEEYAPEGWTKSQGTPDVVAMVYDPQEQLNIERKSFTDYDEAMKYRDSYVEEAKKLQTTPVETKSVPQKIGEGLLTALGISPESDVKFSKIPGEPDIITSQEEKERQVVEKMNEMELVNNGIDFGTSSTTKEKIDVKELNSRLETPLKEINWSDYEGIPFGFTISDQLRSGDVENPSTGETVTDLKGGIGFNGTKGNEDKAWANTTKDEGNSTHQKAVDIYNNNKPLFEKLWKEGKIPNGVIPFGVVKMGENSIVSNEALSRVAVQNIETLPKSNRKKAVAALAKSMKDKIVLESDSLKRGVDQKGKPYTENTIKLKKKSIKQYEKILDIINKYKYNDIANILKDKNHFSLPERSLIMNQILYGKPNEIGAKSVTPGNPTSLVSKTLLEGLDKSKRTLINLGNITDLITEPSMKNIPNMHIVSIVGVKVAEEANGKWNPAGGVVETNHPNYKYGVQGESIGIISKPIHMKDAFGEAYGSALGQVVKNEANKTSITEKGAFTQGIPVQAGLPNRVFKSAIAKGNLDSVDKLSGFLRQAFPSVTFFTSQDAWNSSMEEPSIKKKLKDGEVVYAFTTDGNIFINPNLKTTKATLHETGHIWMSFVKENNPDIHNKGLSLVDGTKEYQKAKEQYGDIELAREEALMELMSSKGDTIVNAAQKAKFKEWLLSLYKYISENFNSLIGLSPKQIENLTLDKFLEGMLADILSGKELTSKKIKGDVKFSLESQDSKIRDYIESQRNAGVSDEDIKSGIESVADKLKLSTENINDLMTRKEVNAESKGLDVISKGVANIDDFFSEMSKDKDFNSLTEEQKKDLYYNSVSKYSTSQAIDQAEQAPKLIDLKDQNWLKKFIQSFQNKMIRVKDVQEQMEGALGIKILKEANVALKFELLVGKTINIIEDKQKEIFDRSDKSSLANRAKKDGVDLDQLGTYMYALHADERNLANATERQDNFNKEVEILNEKIKNTDSKSLKTRYENELKRLISGQGKVKLLKEAGSGMTNQQAQEIIDNVDKSGKKELFDKYAKEFRETVIKPSLDAKLKYGLIDKELYNKLQTQYKNYVPLQVIEKAMTKRAGAGGVGASVKGRDIFKAKGSDLYKYTDRYNPLFSSMFEYQNTIARGERNQAAQALINLAELDKNNDVFEVLKPKYTAILNSNGEINYMLETTSQKLINDSVELKVDGKPVYVEIKDKAMRDALQSQGIQRGIRGLHIINSWIRSTATLMNPNFLITNFLRDYQSALINIQSEVKDLDIKNVTGKIANPKNLKAAGQGIIQDSKGKYDSEWAKLAKEYRDSGGKVSWFQKETLEEYVDGLRKDIEKINKGEKMYTAALNKLGNTLMLAQSVVEQSVRLSTFKALKDAGVSTEEAARAAKNITVNFENKGTWGGLMDSLYLFATAGLSGTVRMATSLSKSKTARTIAGGMFAYGILEAALNSHLGGEDDDDEKIDDGIKERNFVLVNPKDSKQEPLLLPMAYGLNVFKYAGNLTYDVATGRKDATEATSKMFMTIYNQISPLQGPTLSQAISPTGLDPFVQNAENVNFFGAPIKPEQPKFGAKKKESDLYFESVRPGSLWTAKKLNEWTGGSAMEKGYIDISPEILDHYYDAIGGGTGKFISDVGFTGKVVSKDIIESIHGKEMKDKDEFSLRRLPFVKAFFGTKPEKQKLQYIYETFERSSIEQLNDDESSKFVKQLREAIQSGALDKQDAKEMYRTVVEGQYKIRKYKGIQEVMPQDMTKKQYIKFIKGAK